MAATGFGLRPYKNLVGAGPNFLVNNGFQIAYNNSHTIGQGDIIIPLNTGYLDIASNSPSNPVLGVFSGCNYPNPNNTIQPQTVRNWSAPTLASTVVVTAQYWDDPDVVFAVQANATSTLTQSAIGLNANFLSNGSPNTTTGISTLILDSTSLSTNASLPLRIVELVPLLNNTISAANGPVLGVTLNTAFNAVPTGI